MTTAREVKRLVAPLLNRHENLHLIGRMIVIKPVHHLLRGIFIERTSIADCFEVCLSIMTMFNKQDRFTMNWDGNIYPSIPGLWLLTDSGISEAVCSKIEKEALPKLNEIGSDIDYIRSCKETVSFVLQRTAPGYVLYRIAEGDLDSARDLISTYEFAAHVWLPHLKRLGLDEKLLALGNKLSLEDRVTLAGLLHEWEAYSVEKLKLGKIWERTPFPLESE